MDLSQVMISNLMVQLGNHTNAEIEEDLLRHMILNSIRAYNVKFKNEFGEMIIACDAGNNWRRQIFPYYKANRRKNREKSEINWTTVFETLNKVRDELKDYFPYRVIHVDGAEAMMSSALLHRRMVILPRRSSSSQAIRTSYSCSPI